MFECIKSGFIENKLITLYNVITELEKEKYDKNIKEFIPNIKKTINSYNYPYLDYDEDRNYYEFIIDNITYGCEKRDFVYIKINDIVIFHNRENRSCEGKFENVYTGWNHKTPNKMLKQIKNDSKIIKKYIKDIDHYMKHYRPNQVQWNKEQETLNNLFK